MSLRSLVVKNFEKLLPLLEQLHSRRLRPRQGRQSPTALRTVRSLLLLYLFNPVATSLLDVPAETVAVLYEHRWTIDIQTYCAIIACIRISLWTGRKPTLRTYEMACFSI